MFKNLVTEQDLKKELLVLKKDLAIQSAVIMTTLLTVLPLVTGFLQKLFS